MLALIGTGRRHALGLVEVGCFSFVSLAEAVLAVSLPVVFGPCPLPLPLVMVALLWPSGRSVNFPKQEISRFGKMVSGDIRCRNHFCGELMQKSQHSRKYQRLLGALKNARQAAGLTQVEVGKRFGAHASFVSKCESGERRIDVIELAAFCRLYNVKVADLLRSIGVE